MTPYIIRTQKDKSTGNLSIVIEGDAGINQIEQLRNKIDSLKAGFKEVNVELRNLNSFDLSTFQMLYAFRSSLNSQNIPVKIQTDLKGELRNIAINTGMADVINKWETK
jgi:hypothetical protein